MLSLAYVTFSASDGVLFTLSPIRKEFALTVLCPPGQTTIVAPIMQAFDGERVKDVVTPNGEYECFEVLMTPPTLNDAILGAHKMFSSFGLSRLSYRFTKEGDPTNPTALAIEPLPEPRQFIVDMPEQPCSFAPKFTQRARSLAGVRSCTVARNEPNAKANLKAMPNLNEPGLAMRIAAVYAEVAAAS